MKFVKCTDGGPGDPVLVPLGNLLIIFKEGVKEVPSSFYAWTLDDGMNLKAMKYTSVGRDVADSLVEI